MTVIFCERTAISWYWKNDTQFIDVIMSTMASKIRRLDCLLSHLFRRRPKKTSALRVTGLCKGYPTATGGFPSYSASSGKCSHLMTSSCEEIGLVTSPLVSESSLVLKVDTHNDKMNYIISCKCSGKHKCQIHFLFTVIKTSFRGKHFFNLAFYISATKWHLETLATASPVFEKKWFWMVCQWMWNFKWTISLTTLVAIQWQK